MGAGGVLVTIGLGVLIHRATLARAPATRAWRSSGGAVFMLGGR
jgi:hypothetical protein